MTDDQLTHSLDTHVYVQFGAGREVFYLGDCVVIPSLPSPSPDRRAAYSSIGARGYRQLGLEPAPPDSPNLAITTFVSKTAGYLEKIKERNCPFNLYVLTARCAANRAFNNYERAWVYPDCEITDDPIDKAVMTEEDKLTEHLFNITAGGARIDHRPLTITRQDVAQTGDARGLAVFPPRCASDCEEAVAACQQVVIGAATVGAAIPDFYYTLDGITWLTQASGFVANTSIDAVSTFQNLSGDYAIVAMRDNLTGNPLRCEVGVIGLSSVLDIGAAPNEGVVRDRMLFVLDARHAWVATDAGRVYFSGDGAQTWAEQPDALTASGGSPLHAIHFADALIGYAAGTGDTIISTTNGGETWADDSPALNMDWESLHVFDRQRLIVGGLLTVGTGGNLFMSYDAATTWANVARWSPTTAQVWYIQFLEDGLTGILTKNAPGATPEEIYKSINGGFDWRPIETPASGDINAVLLCQPNLGWAVGNAHVGTTFIAEISG